MVEGRVVYFFRKLSFCGNVDLLILVVLEINLVIDIIIDYEES